MDYISLLISDLSSDIQNETITVPINYVYQEIIDNERIEDIVCDMDLEPPNVPKSKNHILIDAPNLDFHVQEKLVTQEHSYMMIDKEEDMWRDRFFDNTKNQEQKLIFQNDVNRLFEILTKFFQNRSIFVAGTTFHIAMKKFTTVSTADIWKKWLDNYYQMVKNIPDVNFNLYQTFKSDVADKAHDDRFIMKLALHLQEEDPTNQICILTNDKYRDRDAHWHKTCEYVNISNPTAKLPKQMFPANWGNIEQLYSIHKQGFKCGFMNGELDVYVY